MDCIRTICFYLKGYISHEQFESIFHDYLNDFQNCLREDLCFNILWTNFNSKEKRINIETELRDYVLKNYESVYESINDAYVERMIDSEKEDVVINILKKEYEQKEEIDIDCSIINTQSELIAAIKQNLQYPQFCGNNWDAINDLIYDIVFPKKLIFKNWYEIEKKLPQDTAILKEILDKLNSHYCLIVYA